jgi:predicted methyltransferase
MRTASSLLPLAIAAIATASCASTPPPESPASPAPTAAATHGADRAAIARALAGSQRSKAHRARDAQRHPAETLEFFGLRGNMTVLELWPGAGWYTEILAPIVADSGKLWVTSLDPDGPQDKMGNKLARQLLKRFNAEPWVFNKVGISRIDPPAKLDLAPDDSVDLALVIRNAHDWVRDGYAEQVFAAIHRAVKPGGVLGVVAHRGKPGASVAPEVVRKSGYLPEDYVIKLVEGAGFRLVGRSEINANPKDTADHPEGVWTLPPSFRLKDKDHDKYASIGESDRMTLKFEKPVK